MRLTWPIAHQHTEKSEQNQHVLSYNPIDLIPSPTEELLTGSRGREQQVERSTVAGSRPTGNRWAGYTDNDDGSGGRQRCFARGCEVPVNERVTYRHDLPLIDEGGNPLPCRLTVSIPRWMRIDMPLVEVTMTACGLSLVTTPSMGEHTVRHPVPACGTSAQPPPTTPLANTGSGTSLRGTIRAAKGARTLSVTGSRASHQRGLRNRVP